jgi:hypothetical protein
VKRFFAFWIVTLVIGSLVALIPGFIDSFFATEGTDYAGYACWKGPIIDACNFNKWYPLLTYPAGTFATLIPGYVIFRSVAGSFRIVFSKTKDATDRKAQ